MDDYVLHKSGRRSDRAPWCIGFTLTGENVAGEDIARQTHEALSKWLLLHIKREDKNFVPDAVRRIGGMVKDGSGEDWLSRSVAGFFGKGG
jgi:hypothetical protein